MFNNIFNNLYDELVLEALWDKEKISDENTPFSRNLYKMYELEYKLNALNNYSFNGDPRRLENIKNYVINTLITNATYVKDVLLKVFEKWLSSHAITNPKKWAESRYNEVDEKFNSIEELLSVIIEEYGNYAVKMDVYRSDEMYKKYTTAFINSLEKNIKLFPYLKQLIESFIKERIQTDFYDNEEETKKIYGINSEDDIDTIDVFNYDSVSEYIIDIESLTSTINMLGVNERNETIKQFYQYLVFPVWYKKWKAVGINNTRKLIDKTYKNLKKTNKNDLGDMISIISMALNAVHQTGPMLDYVASYTNEYSIYEIDDDDSTHEFYDIKPSLELIDLLNKLTNGDYINSWNNDLKEIGINI